MVRRIRIDYGLKTQYERLRARGLLSATEIAKYLKDMHRHHCRLATGGAAQGIPI